MRATDIAVQKQVGRKTVFKFPVVNSVAGLFINFRLSFKVRHYKQTIYRWNELKCKFALPLLLIFQGFKRNLVVRAQCREILR